MLCNEGVWFFFEIWSQHSPYATTNLGILLHKMQYPSSCWIFWIISLQVEQSLKCRKKKVIYKKSDFPHSFLSLFIILAIEHKISRDQIEIFLIEVIERWNIKLFSSLHYICFGTVAEKSFYTSIFDLFQFISTRTLLMLASV